jgi:hypothetical protein
LKAEALAYCAAWAALAFAGWHLSGLGAGLLLSVGLFLIVMPTSAMVLTRSGNFNLERGVRWAILALAALALASYVDAAA